jgi:hypothetical protein
MDSQRTHFLVSKEVKNGTLQKFYTDFCANWLNDKKYKGYHLIKQKDRNKMV